MGKRCCCCLDPYPATTMAFPLLSRIRGDGGVLRVPATWWAAGKSWLRTMGGDPNRVLKRSQARVEGGESNIRMLPHPMQREANRNDLTAGGAGGGKYNNKKQIYNNN